MNRSHRDSEGLDSEGRKGPGQSDLRIKFFVTHHLSRIRDSPKSDCADQSEPRKKANHEKHERHESARKVRLNQPGSYQQPLEYVPCCRPLGVSLFSCFSCLSWLRVLALFLVAHP